MSHIFVRFAFLIRFSQEFASQHLSYFLTHYLQIKLSRRDCKIQQSINKVKIVKPQKMKNLDGKKTFRSVCFSTSVSIQIGHFIYAGLSKF
jgi:hypothetical protein